MYGNKIEFSCEIQVKNDKILFLNVGQFQGPRPHGKKIKILVHCNENK